VVRLRRDIRSLENQTGTSGGASELVAKLTLLREKLSEARQKYSEEHPDVKKLYLEAAQVEKALRDTSFPKSTDFLDAPAAPDNPAYVTLKTQLDTVIANLKAENSKKVQLGKKLDAYEKRVQGAPAVERDYLALNRDYDNAVKKYDELKNKQLEAQMGLSLEKDAKAGRLTVVEPARIPTAPASPNRRAIILLSAVLGLIVGIGTASVAEYVDRTVHGTRGILAVFEAPPLASIPFIPNEADFLRKRRQVVAGTLVSAAVVIVFVTAVHLFWVPLDQLWLNAVQSDGEELAMERSSND
jgi:uncharacterized protein involved in exopolysaccharide biosynthesis